MATSLSIDIFEPTPNASAVRSRQTYAVGQRVPYAVGRVLIREKRTKLPAHVLRECYSYLSARDIASAARACKDWRASTRDMERAQTLLWNPVQWRMENRLHVACEWMPSPDSLQRIFSTRPVPVLFPPPVQCQCIREWRLEAKTPLPVSFMEAKVGCPLRRALASAAGDKEAEVAFQLQAQRQLLANLRQDCNRESFRALVTHLALPMTLIVFVVLLTIRFGQLNATLSPYAMWTPMWMAVALMFPSVAWRVVPEPGAWLDVGLLVGWFVVVCITTLASIIDLALVDPSPNLWFVLWLLTACFVCVPVFVVMIVNSTSRPFRCLLTAYVLSALGLLLWAMAWQGSWTVFVSILPLGRVIPVLPLLPGFLTRRPSVQCLVLGMVSSCAGETSWLGGASPPNVAICFLIVCPAWFVLATLSHAHYKRGELVVHWAPLLSQNAALEADLCTTLAIYENLPRQLRTFLHEA